MPERRRTKRSHEYGKIEGRGCPRAKRHPPIPFIPHSNEEIHKIHKLLTIKLPDEAIFQHDPVLLRRESLTSRTDHPNGWT